MQGAQRRAAAVMLMCSTAVTHLGPGGVGVLQLVQHLPQNTTLH